MWLKVYPTYEVLGLRLGLDKGNARRNVLNNLGAFDDFPLDPPDGDPARWAPPRWRRYGTAA